MNLSPFAFTLFSLLSSSEESNLLLSPYSIASALSMLLAGATLDSTAYSQFTLVLNAPSQEALPSLAQEIQSASEDSGDSVAFTQANGVWTQGPIHDSYLATLKEVHNATAQSLSSMSTYDPINEYIANATNDLISNIFEPATPIDPLVRAVLVNAIYFKGKWKTPFDKSDTINGTFVNYKGQEKECNFMQMTKSLKVETDVEELGNATIVQLDYGAEEKEEMDAINHRPNPKNPFLQQDGSAKAPFRALFLLPPDDQPSSMNNLISELTSLLSSSSSQTTLHSILPPESQKVHLLLPKFKLQYGTTSLNSPLQSMGLTAPFQSNTTHPPFLRLSPDPQVYLSDVLHQATLEVNEEGTEAAAATIGVVMTRSMPRPPLELVFDRPFVMMVVHVDEERGVSTPLFLGKMMDPVFT